MPNCFQLIRNGDKEPRKLQEIDDDFWFLFEGKIEQNDKWYCNWYNVLGLIYACGKSTEEAISFVKETNLEKVAEFIDANYTVSSWYEHK
jgi:hypothetical protein